VDVLANGSRSGHYALVEENGAEGSLTYFKRWRDPRVIAWFLSVSSGALLVSLVIGNADPVEEVVSSPVIGLLLSLIVARGMSDPPPRAARTLVPIFGVEAAVSVVIWTAVRLV
jgi:hypothetical protein